MSQFSTLPEILLPPLKCTYTIINSEMHYTMQATTKVNTPLQCTIQCRLEATTLYFIMKRRDHQRRNSRSLALAILVCICNQSHGERGRSSLLAQFAMENGATVQRLRISVVELQRVPSSVLMHGSKLFQIRSRNGDPIFHHKPPHWLVAPWSCQRAVIVIIGVASGRKKQIIREFRVNLRIVALNVVEG